MSTEEIFTHVSEQPVAYVETRPSGEDPIGMAEYHARRMMIELGIPCEDESTVDTPRRFVVALLELTSGVHLDPDRHFSRVFPPPSNNPGMIIVPGIPFTSVCEHHLLAFTGTACIGYVPSPGAKVVGLSKLARVTQEYAARPQMQERLGDEIVEAIVRNLDVEGAACILRSRHSCMTLRGARAVGAEMVTSHLRGAFRDNAAMRDEFLKLSKIP